MWLLMLHGSATWLFRFSTPLISLAPAANAPALLSRAHYPKWLAARHPKRKQRRQEAEPVDTYYCPVNVNYRRFLCDTMNGLLEGYPFHGLLVDLRHYPFYSGSDSDHVLWCYCDSCRKGTLRDLGFDPADVDFTREHPMVERWKEWQATQMDQALAYIRMRSLKARRDHARAWSPDDGLRPWREFVKTIDSLAHVGGAFPGRSIGARWLFPR